MPKSFFKGLSSFLAFFLNHILHYRSAVIVRNLRKSFPEKSKSEIGKIKKDFYLNLADVFTEVIYTQSYTRSQVMKKFRVFNDMVIENLTDQHKDIVLVTSHSCNWEIGLSALPLFLKSNAYAIYKPLKNKTSEYIINKIRGRFGLLLIPKKESPKFILKNKGKKNIWIFIADQTPYPENAIWTNFLNQPTPVFRGAELMAKKLNCPVVFLYNRRIKRGKYELGFEIITEKPNDFNETEITKLHVKQLEGEIKKAPASWLWSHKRWKHKLPEHVNVN